MDPVLIFKTLKSEGFRDEVSLGVLQFLTVLLSTTVKVKDFKESGKFLEKVSKKSKRVLWRLSKDDFDLVYRLSMSWHDWDIGQTLNGLGGCTAKTFRELLNNYNQESQQ